MAINQDTRVAKIETPLGKDVLGLTRYDITEGLSELFEWRVEVIAEDHKKVDFTNYMDQGCSITHKSYTSDRVFHARLVEANYVGVRGRFIVYNLIMRPWLWMLSRWTDCRIYQNKNVPDIVKDVFDRRGFRQNMDYELRLHESHEKREYCVQYRETDLAFVSRLMEEEGIYYFFEHKNDRHTCVLADSKSAHRPNEGLQKITWASVTGTDWFLQEHLFDWHSENRLRTAKFEFNDYDFKKPNKKLKATSQAKGKFEFFDHPGNYTETGLGEHRAKVRQEAEQALDSRRYATGDCAQLYPGGLVKLEKHPEGGENQEYLVVRTTHSYTTESYESESTPATSSGSYTGSYEVQPKDRPYRAPVVTSRPLVYGMHMARVTGPSGEEIYVDEHGRIKVQFFWDRYGKSDENSSCWIRVAQSWAGSNWGSQFIPRIGMEVIVTYEEGDPDRPFVLGCLYNGDNKYPYKMPDDKTQSGLKSNSSKGGGGYNEFMFEDKKSEELIRMHAQKDHQVDILNKETTKIGEKFMPPRGSASRDHTILNGDDDLKINMGDQNLKIQMGDQDVNIALGNQKTFAMQKITQTSMMQNQRTVIVSNINMTPAAINLTAPQIGLTGMAMISLTAPIINITAPVINITGVVNITGGLLVNGMVPVLIPA